jgi:glycosyltransferase involved in cell wall biosynthesis
MTENQVLIISFWNPTAENPQQGVFIQDQVAAICSLRENIVFLQVNVLPSDNFLLKKTIEDSAFYKNRRIIINLYSRLWKFWYVNPWILARIIYRILKKRGDEINPAIIHSNVISPCGIVGYLLARRMGVKLLISEHWSKAEKLLRHPLYKRIAMRAYRKSFAIICVSEFLSLKIAKATGHENIIVIPNIINSEFFTYLPKTPSGNGRLSLMCVASWRLPKRLDLIVDALCYYALETTRQIDLKVVGNGTQIETLKNRETPVNLHIEWLGYLDKPAIAALLQTTQVFLHASNIETFSIVTAEALATGTPVLVSNTGALPELINEHNGILVENSPTSWLQGIRAVVTKKFDYEAIAIQNQNKYSPGNVGNSILSIYNKVNSDLS